MLDRQLELAYNSVSHAQAAKHFRQVDEIVHSSIDLRDPEVKGNRLGHFSAYDTERCVKAHEPRAAERIIGLAQKCLGASIRLFRSRDLAGRVADRRIKQMRQTSVPAIYRLLRGFEIVIGEASRRSKVSEFTVCISNAVQDVEQNS